MKRLFVVISLYKLSLANSPTETLLSVPLLRSQSMKKGWDYLIYPTHPRSPKNEAAAAARIILHSELVLFYFS